MFPCCRSWRYLGGSFPRARGDVPCHTHCMHPYVRFSPRTRGCSPSSPSDQTPPHVFPAHAGMFRARFCMPHSIGRFPRARGDVPGNTIILDTPYWFSPRTRGCSPRGIREDFFVCVFPAHAGMFRRVRGCPAGWGCSWVLVMFCCSTGVFPAHAGMFRRTSARVHCRLRFPRARGDVPTPAYSRR